MEVPQEKIRQIRSGIPYDLRQKLTKYVLQNPNPKKEELNKIVSEIEKVTGLTNGAIRLVIDDLLRSKEYLTP